MACTACINEHIIEKDMSFRIQNPSRDCEIHFNTLYSERLLTCNSQVIVLYGDISYGLYAHL